MVRMYVGNVLVPAMDLQPQEKECILMSSAFEKRFSMARPLRTYNLDLHNKSFLL